MNAQPCPLHHDLPIEASRDYRRVADAIVFIRAQRGVQPTLDEVARHVGLSPYHFQRLFVRWAGVSPRDLLGALTLDHAKSLLRDDASVLDAALDSGLSGPARLHDLFVSVEAMTPGEYKRRGASLTIRYGFQPTPLGTALVLLSPRGLCGLHFVEPGDEQEALATAHAEWPLSTFVEDAPAAGMVLDRVLGGREPATLHLRGTRLQLQVWRALLAIPPGQAVSYATLARAVGHPGAARAIGNAVGRNPVAVIIPCHRVLRANGALGGYRWGMERKAALLGLERLRSDRDTLRSPDHA